MSDSNVGKSPEPISRRDVLKTAAAVAGAAAISAPTLAASKPSAGRPTLHVYDNYGWLRGFGIIPSWAARIEDAWWEYDGSRMREEIAPAKLLHANCIRLWIEFTAWMRDPDRVTANFHDAVAAIDEAGMKVMPCLFNRWHDLHYDYGGTYLENFIFQGAEMDGRKLDKFEPYREYIRSLVAPLARDERVLIWDLCNEPHAGTGLEYMAVGNAEQKEHAWLADMARTVRACGVQQPVTIGTVGPLKGLSGPSIETYADLCDVLCAHPYARDRTGLEETIAKIQCVKRKYDKPLMANECIPGAEDDLERAALAQVSDSLLSAAGFGWVAWVLREGLAVSTRRDKVDHNGIRDFGFHPWVLKNGRLRDGLEWMTENPKLQPPWKTA